MLKMKSSAALLRWRLTRTMDARRMTAASGSNGRPRSRHGRLAGDIGRVAARRTADRDGWKPGGGACERLGVSWDAGGACAVAARFSAIPQALEERMMKGCRGPVAAASK